MNQEYIDKLIDKWGWGLVSIWCEMTAYIEQDDDKKKIYLEKAKELQDKQSEIIKNTFTIADYYGLDKQCNQTIEECGELIQALAKFNRVKGNGFDTPVKLGEAFEMIIEEIADVQICINQLIYLTKRQYEINEITSSKLNRQIRRIDEEKTRSVENDKR